MLIRAARRYNSRVETGTLVQHKNEDSGDELAQWLEDSGRRRAIRLDDSPETLLGMIEEFAGAKLRSADDIATYFERVKLKDVELRRAEASRRKLREGFLVTLLVLSAAQYYFWDVSLQIASLHKVHYFAAPAEPGRHSASTLPAAT